MRVVEVIMIKTIVCSYSLLLHILGALKGGTRAGSGPKRTFTGREPWFSGYGRRFTSKRSWVQIPVLDTGWIFFTYSVVKIVMFV